MNNFSRSITSNEIAAEIKSLPQVVTDSPLNSIKLSGKIQYQFFLTCSTKQKGRDTTEFFLWSQCYPDAKTRKEHYKKRKLQVNFFGEQTQNLPTKYFQIHEHIKKIMYHEQTGFILKMQGWFNRYKSMNVKYHINKLKVRNPQSSRMIPKGHLAVQYAFMIKVLEMLGIIKGYRQQTYSQHYTK